MSQSFKVNKKGDIIYLTVPSFEEHDGVIHAFSTRHGGVSCPPYSSLNLAFHTGDDPQAVVKNRQHLCSELGIDLADVVTAEQVHGDHVQVITAKDAGAGAFVQETRIKGTDALITKEKVALMAFYADCVPILIYDYVTKAVGLAHSGWRGTLMQIGAKTIKAMVAEFGTRPENCLIGIGPSIGPCCYEIDDNVLQKVQQTFVYWQDLVEEKENGHWDLDLWAANRQSLIGVGVPAENIAVSGMCTMCNHDMLFSYRGENGITGRLAAIIMLK